MAVQRCIKITIIIPQKPIAIKSYVAYDYAHSGWMVMSDVEVRLPHNPLVLGSSPSCPTFSTHTSEQVFEHYTNVAKTSFYAIFTQSTTNDQRNSKQYLFLRTDFSEIFSYFPIFSREQWEFRERDSFSFHFQ